MPIRLNIVSLPARRLALVSASCLMLAGCGVGNLVNHAQPDEFAVQRQAPLTVPPDFALSPPKPGAPRPSDHTGQEQTLEVMFGGPAPRSAVERTALDKSGSSDTAIRSTVADPKTLTAPKGSVTRDVISAPQGDGREAQTQVPAGN